MTRNADEVLINAIQMRDQFDDLRKEMRDTTARLKRKQLNFVWDDPSPDELRPVAEEIWQVAYNERLTLAELHGRTRYCDWKIYQAAYQMVRTGLFTLDSKQDEPLLAGS